MSEYIVTVVEYPAKRLIGMKVRTSMAKADTDCGALWQAFGPRLEELPKGAGGRGSYGVSVMLNAEDFDYWAAVEMAPSAAVPDGLGGLGLPAGLYAKVTVPNLDRLGPAFMYLYEAWPKSQPGYAINYQVPCFELYPPNWQVTDALEAFMPVIKV